MKSKIFAVAFFVLGAVTMLSSFSFKPVTPATGGVKVTVTLNGKPAPGALVGIATSDENRENSDYIKEVETNSAGVVTFSGLAAGKYYLDAFVTDDEDAAYWAEVEVTVGAEVVPVTMKLIPEEEFMEE